jgi:hypothetical protein
VKLSGQLQCSVAELRAPGPIAHYEKFHGGK